MNTQKKIEQSLRAAPKPPAPDGLLENLQADVSAWDIKTHRSALRRWFAPAGGRISLLRVAAAATIAIVVLLPLSYGATKVVKKYFVTFEDEFEYPEDNIVYRTTQTGVVAGDDIKSEEDAKKVLKKALEEFGKLYREGKAKEIRPGVWQVILSNGGKFNYGGNPESLGVSEMELKKQFDEINELRMAGKYERTFVEEIEKDGVKIRLYRDSFTLSNGKVVTLTTGEGK